MKRERTDDSDDEDSDKGKETPNNFTSGTNVEHKSMGRLSEKGLIKEFPKPKLIRTAEPRRSSRQRLKMSADVQARYNADTAINAGFPESVRRIVTQVGTYGILTDTTHGIAHDANIVVLCIFDGLKKGNDWQRMDRLYLGETVSMVIINIRKSPRDIVLTTVLGFVMEGIVESLEKKGQDCSRERLMNLTTKFMDENPRLMEILCTENLETYEFLGLPAVVKTEEKILATWKKRRV